MEAAGAHPARLAEPDGRFAAPVFPGDRLHIAAWQDDGALGFTVSVGDRTVISGGRARWHRER